MHFGLNAFPANLDPTDNLPLSAFSSNMKHLENLDVFMEDKTGCENES